MCPHSCGGRTLKSGCRRGWSLLGVRGRICSTLLSWLVSACQQSLVFDFWLHLSSLCLRLSMAFLRVSLHPRSPSALLLEGNLSLALGPNLNPRQSQLEIRNYNCKDLVFKSSHRIGSKWTYILGTTFQPAIASIPGFLCFLIQISVILLLREKGRLQKLRQISVWLCPGDLTESGVRGITL